MSVNLFKLERVPTYTIRATRKKEGQLVHCYLKRITDLDPNMHNGAIMEAEFTEDIMQAAFYTREGIDSVRHNYPGLGRVVKLPKERWVEIPVPC